ncbi:hypothetical protein CYLTODRAFT_208796 [Cylindrobasidium torrendii FP15055 ss-10]|uniref:Uncharacterized protein n=1 Tax=Cylindrobasidium torrendii FP15055 ss-10 TaxID=1314674 RepID=A0A0D7BJX6_9AGAR|nr:hypothetical protein CYLTODRAFT_208796 [Cylindrobasidium torrendii FP15055 ss-10]
MAEIFATTDLENASLRVLTAGLSVCALACVPAPPMVCSSFERDEDHPSPARGNAVNREGRVLDSGHLVIKIRARFNLESCKCQGNTGFRDGGG